MALEKYIRGASREQLNAWDKEIPILQQGTASILADNPEAKLYTAILEYKLPLESRRPDVILLENGSVVVLEFKSKDSAPLADLDQVGAYARDLRCYHRECADRPVHAVLVPTRYRDGRKMVDGIHVAGPSDLPGLLEEISVKGTAAIGPEKFLREDAYSPLPTLVRAARELFESKTVRRVWRAAAITDPAVDAISKIAHEAHATKTRRLVLLSGVPGSGKTLVGLRLVHSKFLDDLAVARGRSKPSSPAVFLSGNGPLVQVLQYELKAAGGGGRTFVRDVKKYVEQYAAKKGTVPPEHLLVFDEAQRAWDAAKVAAKHDDGAILESNKSEPEHFVEFAERIPEWCVVVGLIGSGQEINEGEEGGLGQWRKAVEESKDAGRWIIHGPRSMESVFSGSQAATRYDDVLNLTTEIRFHLTPDIHEYVDGLLSGKPAETLSSLAGKLADKGHRLLVTRDLNVAKRYVRERYAENSEARFGLIASARDKDLERFGVMNSFNETKSLRVGPWFSEGEGNPKSCRHLDRVATEFAAQGLELDFSVLCWGTDLIWKDGKLSNEKARGYKRGTQVKDPLQLRVNSYRVLLTRGRDGTVIFLPQLAVLDETYNRLVDSGVRPISD